MNKLTAPLHEHHKHCDDLFADAEAAAQDGDWPGCTEVFARFRNEMEAHFATEEEVLFPAFEDASGTRDGPSQVMRGEHAVMRQLMEQMAGEIEHRDADAFAGDAGTLLILMEQHNMKEEHILYPMCGKTLSPDVVDLEASLRERLQAIGA